MSDHRGFRQEYEAEWVEAPGLPTIITSLRRIIEYWKGEGYYIREIHCTAVIRRKLASVVRRVYGVPYSTVEQSKAAYMEFDEIPLVICPENAGCFHLVLDGRLRIVSTFDPNKSWTIPEIDQWPELPELRWIPLEHEVGEPPPGLVWE